MILDHYTKIDVREHKEEIIEILAENGLKWCTEESIVHNMNNVGFLFIQDANRSECFGPRDYRCTQMGIHEYEYFRHATAHRDITEDVLKLILPEEKIKMRHVLKELNG